MRNGPVPREINQILQGMSEENFTVDANNVIRAEPKPVESIRAAVLK
jgi:hypothetical protein